MHPGPDRVDAALLRRWGLDIVRHLEHSGLLLWDIELPPDAVIPAHLHELPFFCLLLDGWLESTYGQRAMVYHRFLNVFHPAGTVHTSRVGPRGARILTLEATAAWTDRLHGIAALPEWPSVVVPEEGAWIGRRLFREISSPQPCSQLVIEALALDLLAVACRLPRQGPAPPRWLANVVDRLHARLEEPVTVQQLAIEVGLPAPELSAVFRRHTGKSVGEYRRSLQVDYVRERLASARDAAAPLAEIALAAGFADQAHCTRVFKAATGWTPARYRREALGGDERWRGEEGGSRRSIAG